MKRITLLFAASVLALSACTPTGTPSDQTNSSSSSVSSDSGVQETKNVLYRGTVEKQGVSIFMEGTHRLRLDDGRFILMESDVVDLNPYIGMKVEVFGAVRPTTEKGGLIMRVERVTSLEPPSSSSSSSASTIFCGGIAAFPCPDGMQCADNPSDSCDPNHGGADCGGICVPAASVSSVSSVEQSSMMSSSSSSLSSKQSSSASSASSVASTTTSVSSSDWQASTDLTAKAAVMAKDKMDASYWTKIYCSPHIGYCIPYHKNWWFNSFGATASSLWHVEIGPSEISNLGEGPITVDLMSGDTTSDGSVTVSGDTVVGIRSWTGGRHFEIRGPTNLETAIRYITAQLKSQN